MTDDQVEEVLESIDNWIERLKRIFSERQSLSYEHFHGARTCLRDGTDIEVSTEEIQESYINATFLITTPKTPIPITVELLFPIIFESGNIKLSISSPPGYDRQESQIRHIIKKWA